MIRITPVGGYGEVGRNMTLVEVDDHAVVLDMGFHMENLIKLETHKNTKLTQPKLSQNEVIPNDKIVPKSRVKGIILSHGHLDHIAAIPYMEENYNCPIIATPYTIAIIKRQFVDNDIHPKNKCIALSYNKKFELSKKITVELIRITHSIPQTAMIVIHTPYGKVVYANDFKLDPHPTVGKKTDSDAIKALKNVKILISECLYAHAIGKTPSESIAKQMLEDILLTSDIKNKGIFVTTFSSHIDRLTTIERVARKLNRKVIFLGRSLAKYSQCAKEAGVSKLLDNVDVYQYRSLVRKKLRKLSARDKKKSIIMMTGHQGEPHAVLQQMLDGKLQDVFDPNDVFIFSCNTIPTPQIIAARQKIEAQLQSEKLRLYKNVHVSGHAQREDLRELLLMLKPQHVIPAHGTLEMMQAYQSMAEEENYVLHKNLHLLVNGEHLELP